MGQSTLTPWTSDKHNQRLFQKMTRCKTSIGGRPSTARIDPGLAFATIVRSSNLIAAETCLHTHDRVAIMKLTSAAIIPLANPGRVRARGLEQPRLPFRTAAHQLLTPCIRDPAAAAAVCHQ